jgi:hypothetical protein
MRTFRAPDRPAAAINPAGGIAYHRRAARHRRALWPSFVEPLGAWLREWRPRSPDLLLVGPSGGYCLDPEFLAGFRTLRAVDPDPLAAAIFRARYPALAGRVRWSREDVLGPVAGRLGTGGLAGLLARHPGHAVLFANVLGQLACLWPAAVAGRSFGPFARTLVALLRGREWASFHDRLSGPGAPGAPLAPLVLPGALAGPALAARVRRVLPGLPADLRDHGTAELFPGLEALERRILGWQIAPGVYHLVEAVRGPAPG